MNKSLSFMKKMSKKLLPCASQMWGFCVGTIWKLFSDVQLTKPSNHGKSFLTIFGHFVG